MVNTAEPVAANSLEGTIIKDLKTKPTREPELTGYRSKYNLTVQDNQEVTIKIQ